MSVEKKKPSKKLVSLIHEAVDTGIKLIDIVDKIWKQGAEEGFSREEIAEIVRPIARERGLNKDQVYYLTHKPEILEKSKSQYEELKNRNITRITEDKWNYEYEDMILDRVEGIDSMEKYILDIARLFRKLGYSEDKIFTETKRMCKAGGYGPAELDHVDVVLHWKYDLYRKLDNFPGDKQPPKFLVQYIKIAATLDLYGIPRDKISAKIKEIATTIQGKEESHVIDWALQPMGTYADPNIRKGNDSQEYHIGELVNSICPRKYGGYVDDEVYEAERAEQEIGIGDGRSYNADEKYCRHCIAKKNK